MSIIGLLIALGLSLITLVIVARPLFTKSRRSSAGDDGWQLGRDRLREYYERVLSNIRDLDEDFSTGKISEEDYKAERAVWVHRGIRLLRVGDQLEAQRVALPDAVDAAQIDRAIEAAVAAYRDGAELTGSNPDFGER